MRDNYSPEMLTYDEAYYLVGQIQRGKKHLIPTPPQIGIIKGRDWNFSIEGLDKSTASDIINEISEQEGWSSRR